MADNNTEKTVKKDGQGLGAKISAWWKGLKSEYSKIVWDNTESVTKQTTAVVVITVILGIIIAIVDWVLKNGIDFITKL
ncbi:MAG: preprotein translocase subunit SecE [Lachnospiraceae bacterium]|nr:preprotein translocase subunit SecE [Lachnospiraceae bacterium]